MLHGKKEKGSIYEFEHISKSSEYNGKGYLMSSSSLHSKDYGMKINLLDMQNKSERLNLIPKSIKNELNQNIFTVTNILSGNECEIITNKLKEYKLQKMEYGRTRKNKRIVIFDNPFSEYLWEKIKSSLENTCKENSFEIYPLGFNVLSGNWKFSGINKAVRYNSYESEFNEIFSIHRDSQFCPSGDERSLLSLVIYLNDDFTGGETNFYIPKNSNIDTKGFSLQEELSKHSGINEGYNCITVTPSCGSAVIFNQNILHESAALTSSTKRILKTDIMVSRRQNIGFQICEAEHEDYFQCLNLFRQAQQNEIIKNDNISNELYERCLSIRYSYPTELMLSARSTIIEVDPSQNADSDSQYYVKGSSTLSDSLKQNNPFLYFPIEVWTKIFIELTDEVDVYNLVEIFPDLHLFKRPFDKKKIVPRVEYNQGVFGQFRFCSSAFVKSNLEACCRVLAGYAIFLLGHHKFSDTYTVEYNADKNKITTIPLQNFLSSIFYNEASFGAVYSITQQDSTQYPEDDFRQSVERNYMLLKHNKEFVGIDCEAEFRFDGIITCSEREYDSEFNVTDDEYSEEENSNAPKDNLENLKKENLAIAKHNLAKDNMEKENLEKDKAIADSSNDNIDKVDDVISIDEKNNHSPFGSKIDQKVINYEELAYTDSNLSAEFMNFYARMYENIIDNRPKSFYDEEDYEERRKKNQPLNYEHDCKAHLNLPQKSYLEYLHETLYHCNNNNNISSGAAIIQKLGRPKDIPFMKSNEQCECFMGDHGVTCYLASNQQNYNHLIADFSKEEFLVSKNIPENDIMFKHLIERVLFECNKYIYVNDDKSSGAEVKECENIFCVDISSFANSKLSFNHSSCQCIFPAAQVDEYTNLQSYPLLKNVYIIFKQKGDIMYAWTCYGGIVPL